MAHIYVGLSGVTRQQRVITLLICLVTVLSGLFFSLLATEETGYYEVFQKDDESLSEKVEVLERELVQKMFRFADGDEDGFVDAFEMFTWVQARHHCDDGHCVQNLDDVSFENFDGK